MEIQNCIPSDLDGIYKLYEAARALQTAHNMVVWPHFEKPFLEQEILEQRQWKVVIDHEMACNWVVTYSDEDIWEERDKGDAIYLHRIATNPDFRGRQLVKSVVEWAKNHAIMHQRKYVRLDTLGMNTRLIEHYTGCGFDFLGVFQLKNTEKLPLHYQKEPRCLLFELAV